MPHIYQLDLVQISDNYVSIYASFDLTTNNSVTRITGIHTFHINTICLEQICLPHYTYMHHCTTTCIQTPHYQKHVFHSTAIFVPATYMPPIYHIYAISPNYLMCTNGEYMPVFITNMSSPSPTTWPAVLYTDDDDANDDTMTTIPMVMQPDSISWVGQWPNEPKIHHPWFTSSHCSLH